MMVFLLSLLHLGKRFPSVIARLDRCDEFLMNLVAFRAYCRRNVRELPQIINHMPRIREYVERDEYETQHRPGHLSPRPVVPGKHRKRTPEEMEELRQEAERERAERYRDLYERLGLKVIAFKDKTLEVAGQSA
jgi:hypothetical protein